MSGDYSFPERQQIAFSIGDQKFIMKEAGAFAAKRYKTAMLSSAKIKGDEAVGVDADMFVDRDYQLLADCCFRSVPGATQLSPITQGDILGRNRADKGKDKDGKADDKEGQGGWPDRACKALIAKLKEMSDLDQDSTQEGIEKQIELLQKQLAKLKGTGTVEERAKNEQKRGGVS